MPHVFCLECSQKADGYVRHEWPPCDLNADGAAKDALPCGHRRPYRQSDGTCAECKKKVRRP